MRKTLFYILSVLLLVSCSVKDDCKNRFDFISSDASIPIIDLDITKHSDSIRKELSDLYGFDLCKKCSWIYFKLPMTIEDQQGYLKVMVDYDSPYCENCPVPMRLRYYYSIWINQRNQILVQDELTDIDSLQTKIGTYLAGVGTNKMSPNTFKQVNFRLFWNQDSDIEFLKSVLTKMYNSHLVFVESKLKKEGIDFCKLDKTQITRLKEKYPLRIEFDLGKLEKMAPTDIEDLNKWEEIIEEIELKKEME